MNRPCLILCAFFTMQCFAAFCQSNERMQSAQPANVKPPSDKAMELNNDANEHFSKKEYALAITGYKQAIAVDSDYVDAYNNLGLALYESNSLDSAEHYLRTSLHYYPDGVTALQDLGLVEEKKRDLAKASDCYKKITVLQPDNPEGFYNSARILTTLAKFDEALVQAQMAEKLYTKTNSPYTKDCHYMLLVIYFNTRNKPMAKQYLALCKKEGVPVQSAIETGLQ